MYTPILASLGFILSPDGKKTLLVHRNRRFGDYHLGKYNGLGGKMETGEDILTCMKREIMEEAGIKVTQLCLRGTINWPGFGGEWEDWFGFIFLVTGFEGEPYRTNEEGDLLWVDINELENLPMWEGDRHFIPLVFDEDPRMFYGVMPYENGHPVSWSYERL